MPGEPRSRSSTCSDLTFPPSNPISFSSVPLASVRGEARPESGYSFLRQSVMLDMGRNKLCRPIFPRSSDIQLGKLKFILRLMHISTSVRPCGRQIDSLGRGSLGLHVLKRSISVCLDCGLWIKMAMTRHPGPTWILSSCNFPIGINPAVLSPCQSQVPAGSVTLVKISRRTAARSGQSKVRHISRVRCSHGFHKAFEMPGSGEGVGSKNFNRCLVCV